MFKARNLAVIGMVLAGCLMAKASDLDYPNYVNTCYVKGIVAIPQDPAKVAEIRQNEENDGKILLQFAGGILTNADLGGEESPNQLDSIMEIRSIDTELSHNYAKLAAETFIQKGHPGYYELVGCTQTKLTR